MKIRNYIILSFLYIISISAYLINSYGFFYKLRPYLYIIAFILVVYDLFYNIKVYKRNIDPHSGAFIPITFILLVEFVSIFYSHNKLLSLQLFVTNIFLISTLIIYLSNMERNDINKFFQNIIIINALLYIVSIILLIIDYRLATVTRFGLYTFSGVFYSKQMGITSLITIFSIDMINNSNFSINNWLKRSLPPLYFLSVLFIILSFSRGVFLSLIIYWGILMYVKKNLRKYMFYYISLILIIILLYIFRPFDYIIKYTVTDRQYFIKYAVHIYNRYFIRGNGYGCGKFLTLLPEAAHYLRHDLMGKQFHNSYLEIYFDTGLPGLTFFVWMIVVLFKRMVKYKMLFLMALIIPILFLNLFTSSLAYPSSLSYLFSYMLIIYGLIKREDLLYTEYSPEL